MGRRITALKPTAQDVTVRTHLGQFKDKHMATEAPEVKRVSTKRVSCDGGEGALGHPRVYLDMGDKNEVTCPYCDRLFVYDENAS